MAADFDITGSRIVSTFNSESTVTRFSTFKLTTPQVVDVDSLGGGGGGGGSTRPTSGLVYPRPT